VEYIAANIEPGRKTENIQPIVALRIGVERMRLGVVCLQEVPPLAYACGFRRIARLKRQLVLLAIRLALG